MTHLRNPLKNPPKDEKKISLSVSIFKEKVTLKENETNIEIPNIADAFDETKLKSEFTRWRQAYVDKKDVVLNTDKEVTYGQLIKMYDLLVISDWPDVGINPQ